MNLPLTTNTEEDWVFSINCGLEIVFQHIQGYTEQYSIKKEYRLCLKL